ncbi:hypothetical protein BST37_20005 [Mycobacterium noviomagense]|nr:hypothetical protein BST37_20005 [Mycobacterium noviomagense]
MAPVISQLRKHWTHFAHRGRYGSVAARVKPWLSTLRAALATLAARLTACVAWASKAAVHIVVSIANGVKFVWTTTEGIALRTVVSPVIAVQRELRARWRWRVAWWRYTYVPAAPLPHRIDWNKPGNRTISLADIRLAFKNPPGSERRGRRPAPLL